MTTKRRQQLPDVEILMRTANTHIPADVACAARKLVCRNARDDTDVVNALRILGLMPTEPLPVKASA